MNSQVKAELMFIFSQLHTKHLKMIPSDIIKDAQNGFDEIVFFNFDKSKPFLDQNISEETLEILDNIFSKIPDEDFE